MEKNLAIKLKGVTKIYRLHHSKPTLIEKGFGGGQYDEKFYSLKGIDLEIKKGERLGLLGSNGSGKTTLLKIISGITQPSGGRVETRGKLVSLIDLNAGFHPELTGEENIYLNALLLGMGREEVRSKYNDIIQFADIGSFINSPMYTYSTGMKLRLGFSIAVSTNPDILILDEGISAGDENFQKKSTKKIDEFFRQKKTILVVSHWLEYIKLNCSRVLWLKEGKMVADGGTEVIEEYRKNLK